MQYVNSIITEKIGFYKGANPQGLIEKFGSPLYVYSEAVLLEKMRAMKSLVKYENFRVNFSAKANSNLAILQIACREGLSTDAMSPGEIYAQLSAGFSPDKIFYVCNNVSDDELLFAIEKGVTISADSVSQLSRLGRLGKKCRVSLRINGGKGAGHHEKVITAGENTKFGINPEYLPECVNIMEECGLILCGINQHIGSQFLDENDYIRGVLSLLDAARGIKNLEFIDFGGGFGIPYKKSEGQAPLNLRRLGERLDTIFEDFSKEYGKRLELCIEPGRFICAESGVLLGVVHAIKKNRKKYIGTDLGFNVLIRPSMYDSHHDIEIYRSSPQKSEKNETVTIVGNICESGDILAKDRLLPEILEGDILGVLDAGAYGSVMSSNYNNRLRPAEVLIRESGEVVLIRKRDTLESLLQNYIKL